MKTSTSYQTKQRGLILHSLIKYKGKHVTVDQIRDDLKKENANVGKTTIYRYLDKLVSQGFVRKYFIEEGTSACYQYMDDPEDCSEHFHLKCVDCGKLIHMDCNYLDETTQHVLNHHGFHIDHSKTVLYGRCTGCTGKKP